MKRELVISALNFVESEKVPYNIELTSEMQAMLTAKVGISKADFFEYAGNHIEKLGINQEGSYIKEGHFKDEFGVVWNRSGQDKDIGVVEKVLFSEAEIGDYVFPTVDEELIRKKCTAFFATSRDSFKLAKLGMTYFERAWSMRGFENMLMDFLVEEDFVFELLGNILEYNMKIIGIALEYDFDGFYFGDDYGQQSSLLMNPETWRKFIKPGLAEMFSKVKKARKFVAMHSCGDLSAILDDMVEIGLDAYQTVQPEIYDLATLKAKYDKKLSFWGCISTQQTLPYCTPEELRVVLKDTIDIMNRNGGFILAPTHQVSADVPVENIVAMIDYLVETLA